MFDWKRALFRHRGAIMALMALMTLMAARPNAASMAAGLLLGLLGEGIRLWAIGFSGEHTRKQTLDAPQLVTAGPYSLVRNPLYLGNICNGLGVTMAAAGGLPPHLSLALWLSNLTVLLGLYGTLVTLEQAFLEEQFGEEYKRYCSVVPALWPRDLSGLLAKGGTRAAPLEQRYDGKVALRYEISSLGWWLVTWGWLYWRLH